MAGQGGLEPPTLGFGVRCSTIRATGLHSLFRFFMQSMSFAERTVFLELQLLGNRLLVFCRCIVTLLACLTSENDVVSHRCPAGVAGAGLSPGSCSLTLLKSFRSKTSRRRCAAYSTISVTTPAPTVWPPSRIAKRRPASIAIGVINSAVMWTLSPGMTISTPSASVQTPVTSVVRK